MAWSRQQQTWSQVANAGAAPVQAGQQPIGNANNPPVVKPPVVANPPPPNNPGGNNGGWKPPHKPPGKPPICERDDKGWWQPGKQYHGDKDHGWPNDKPSYKHGHDGGHHWPQVGSKGGDNKSSWLGAPSKNKDDNYSDVKYGSGWLDKHHDDRDKSSNWSQLHSNGYSDRFAWLQHDKQDDHDKPAAGWGAKKDDGHDKPAGFGWPKQPLKSEHDSYAWLKPDQHDDDKGGYGGKQPDKDHWQQHGDNYNHGGWPHHPDKPGWPPKNPPPNNGGGQPKPPPQGNNGNPPPQNPPPVAGGGNVAPLPVAAVQIPTAVSANGSDAIGGLQIGCDYQVDRLVLGVQAMADLGVINGSSALGPQLTLNTSTRNLYTATLRAGYLVTPEILAYVRGGAAWTRTSVSVVNTATGQSAMAAFNRSGWTVGAGVEWMFARNWSAFAEYDYADFGTVTGTVPGAVAVTGGPNVVSQKTQLHTALIGVNYRFEMLSRGGR
ncbi:outer membrane protein [Bradyrhizobium oligotrophicum]|uniref:outer membrane protein n=1 Tax=Bradyrhizobium oligotrophicum TaxID=44255 RepID=UPI003EBFA3D3